LRRHDLRDARVEVQVLNLAEFPAVRQADEPLALLGLSGLHGASVP
jgi:hypothetical protein